MTDTIKLDELELLKAENFKLKKSLLQAEAMKLEAAERQYKDFLSNKYGVDIGAYMINSVTGELTKSEK